MKRNMYQHASLKYKELYSSRVEYCLDQQLSLAFLEHIVPKPLPRKLLTRRWWYNNQFSQMKVIKLEI